MTRRVTEVRSRTFRPALPPDALSLIQLGTLRTTYRGRGFFKDPFDVVLYQELIGRLRPATILEVGTKDGGSAVWFADQQAAHGIAARVVTVDVADPPVLDDPRVTCIRGDALALDRVLPDQVLATLARPWLVVEDSAHLFEASLAVLEFFDPRLQRRVRRRGGRDPRRPTATRHRLLESASVSPARSWSSPAQ